MNVGSLFTGIGGIDLGLERAGFTIAWQCETDPFCRRVLRRHWPGVPLYGDVHTLGRTVHPAPVDLVCGGFPCQPVSSAGRGGGSGDARWLWPEFHRVIRLVGPRIVFVENVPGITVRGLGTVLGDLAACGYDAEWDSIGAADLGAPHRRVRVWIVAHRRSGTLADPDSGGRPGRAGTFGPGRRAELANHDPWPPEPRVGRIAPHGIPDRMDRLRVLGNAVVPQLAEVIGRWILEVQPPDASAGTQ